MAYGVITHVPAPIELYDAIHSLVKERTGTEVDGLLLHIGRPSAAGFDVVEVWDSKEQFDRYNRELVAPLVAEASGGGAPPPDPQQIEEFEVRGLVIPSGDIIF